jgi:hypothetical protein
MGTRGFETEVADLIVHEVYGSWSEHVWSWTRNPHPAIHVMRYEDMLDDPEKAFGGLAAHLRLAATPAQIALAVERASFKQLRAQEEKAGFRERPREDTRFFREGRTDQWKEALTAAQIERIVRDHGEQMARFGYASD